MPSTCPGSGSGLISKAVVRQMTFWGRKVSFSPWEIPWDYLKEAYYLQGFHVVGALPCSFKWATMQWLHQETYYDMLLQILQHPNSHTPCCIHIRWVWISSSGHRRYSTILGDERNWALRIPQECEIWCHLHVNRYGLYPQIPAEENYGCWRQTRLLHGFLCWCYFAWFCGPIG